MLLLLAACNCPEETVKAPNGECLALAENAETPEQALEQLPDCAPLATGDRLDIESGCADGLCAGSSFSQLNAENGVTGDCEASFDDDYLYCNWGGEVFAFFDDEDNDGVPDADDTAYGIYIHDEWDGTDADGLGIGVSPACVLAFYGEAADYDYDQDDRGYYTLRHLRFDEPDFTVWVNTQSQLVEHFSLFGP